jgi:predicted permease
MSGVVEVVTPVFAMIALGYLAARFRLVDERTLQGMTLFVFGLAAPALLFIGGTRPHEGGGGAVTALLTGSVLVYFASVAFARRVLRVSAAEAAIFALACVFGNSVMMGVPLVIAAYGEAGVPHLLAILALQTLVLLGTATVMTELGLNAAAPWRLLLRATAEGILRNPIVLAVIAAVLWNAFAWPVPGTVRRTLEFLGAAAPPLALFCLGGGLAGIAAAAMWRETLAIVAIKLLVLPLVVATLGWLLGLAPIEMAVAVTVAALPVGANAFILARRYATGADRSGSAVVISTAISVLTLSALIGHFRGILP